MLTGRDDPSLKLDLIVYIEVNTSFSLVSSRYLDICHSLTHSYHTYLPSYLPPLENLFLFRPIQRC